MYCRLGNGFKSNHDLIKEVQVRSSRRSDSNRSRRGDSSKIRQGPQQSNTNSEPMSEMLDRFLRSLQLIVDEHRDLPIVLKGQLIAILKLGKKISLVHPKQNNENEDRNAYTTECTIHRQKKVLIDRLKTQSQVHILMEKLVKSKDKRVKLTEDNFRLKEKLEQQCKQNQRLRKLLENQKHLVQSCVREIDKLRCRGRDLPSTSEHEQDLLQMITTQAQELGKFLRQNRNCR